jgi:hypothetical protein
LVYPAKGRNKVSVALRKLGGLSSLIIRVPGKETFFVLAANTNMLSASYPLGNGGIWVSPYAKEFLKSFVLAGAKL